MRLLLAILFIPAIVSAQNGRNRAELGSHAVEYFSQNGEYRAVCVPPIDTVSAYNILYKKGDKEPLWENLGLYMFDHVGVSNSGKMAWFADYHKLYRSESLKDSMVLHVGGMQIKLGRILSERLYDLPVDPSNNPIGVLVDDTIIHKMAENPFFVDEDKLFVCTKPATLNVFDMNTGAVIYVGPGRAHFTANYYSIPSPPHSKTYPIGFKDSASFQIPFWEDRKKWLLPEGAIGRPFPALKE